jgi:histone H3/H4
MSAASSSSLSTAAAGSAGPKKSIRKPKRNFNKLIIYQRLLFGETDVGLTSGSASTLDAISYKLLEALTEQQKLLLRSQNRKTLRAKDVAMSCKLAYAPELAKLVEEAGHAAIARYRATVAPVSSHQP